MTRACGAAAALFAILAMACGSIQSSAPSPTTQSPAPSPTTSINVTGTFARGASPTCPSGEACDPPNSPSMVVFSSTGKPDVTAHLDANGAFALHLDPGSYSIRVAPPPFSGRLEPSQVRVPADGAVVLRLSIVLPPG